MTSFFVPPHAETNYLLSIGKSLEDMAVIFGDVIDPNVLDEEKQIDHEKHEVATTA